MTGRTEEARIEPAAKSPNYSAPALEKGIDVIELLAAEPQGLSIGEMATRMGRSISELFRVVVVLDRRDWLYKEPGSDRYRVTYKLLEVAHHATPARELTHVAAPLMQAMADGVRQSCHLVVPNSRCGLVALRQESPGSAGFAVRVGTVVKIPSSCSGHVLLAFGTESQRATMMDGAEVPADLAATLEEIRAQGYERLPSPLAAGVVDLSCPVFGFDGQVVAALTIPFLEAIDGAQVGEHKALSMLRQTTTDISAALGWYDRAGEPITPVLSTSPQPRRRRAAAR